MAIVENIRAVYKNISNMEKKIIELCVNKLYLILIVLF